MGIRNISIYKSYLFEKQLVTYSIYLTIKYFNKPK